MRRLKVLAIVLLSCCGCSRTDLGFPKDLCGSKSCRGTYKIGRPYTVLGNTYYPREDKGYKEVGLASWYGDSFHRRKTANGDTFDMNSMTAAHKTLPMPSVVRVTNLENKKSVILIVNDRGPFVNNRIIDVSQKAAKKLGFLENGIAKVKIEFLERETEKLLKTYGFR
jgi:rare lipoprotein A